MIDIPDDFDERLMVGKLPFQPNFVKNRWFLHSRFEYIV